MEVFECLTLTDANVNDLVLFYTSEQLRHLEVAQALFANPPLDSTERQVWARWRWNEMQFHINTIHRLRLEARA
jgi:hypothetical protein